MHYTSWGPRTGEVARLYEENGPRVLAEFTEKDVRVGERIWTLSDPTTITLDDARVFRMEGDPRKDARLEVHLGDKGYTFIRETRVEWVIDDLNGEKVAQFSGASGQLRKAITEFEGETTVPEDEIIGLSYFARRAMEERLVQTNWPLLGSLILLTILGILIIVL